MFSIRLGLKNLSRQKRRNIITILVIAFAFSGYLFLESVMNGMEEMSFENIRNFETGNIQITHPEYWEERDELSLNNFIEWNGSLEESIRQTTGVIGISPELKFSANLNNGIDEMGVVGIGIIPEDYNQVFLTRDYFIAGDIVALEENKAVIGKQLAELMDLEMDDYITLLVRTKEDTFNTIDLEVGGIIHTLNPVLNSRIVLLPLSTVQQSLNTENSVTMISLATSAGVKEESIIQSLENSFHEKKLPLRAYPWRESAANVIALAAAKKGGISAIMLVVLLIGMVGIINNIILSGIERASEVGMMKAMGMQEWEIVFAFMVEAAGIGLLGGLAGCLFGFLGVYWLVNYGIYMGDWVHMSDYGIPVLDRIYGVWNYPAFSYIFVLGVLVAILSSILPAYWAAHKDPVEAIYHT